MLINKNVEKILAKTEYNFDDLCLILEILRGQLYALDGRGFFVLATGAEGGRKDEEHGEGEDEGDDFFHDRDPFGGFMMRGA